MRLLGIGLLPLVAGCAGIHPCANPATHNTVFQVGLSNMSDLSCNEGLDNDLLDPDIYTVAEDK